MTWNLPWALLLLATPVVGSAAVLAARTRSQMNITVALAAAASLVLMLTVVDHVLDSGASSWLSGLLYVDALSALLILTVTLVGVASLLYSIDYLGKAGSPHEATVPRLRRYYVFVLLFLFTMYLVSEANNLGLLWIALEGTTLVSALMVGYYQTRRALEASWKYLILCSAGLAFALFGTLLLYLASVRALGSTGSGLDWTVLVAAGGQLDPGLVRLAIVFLFVGYGTKAGLAPLHTWLPDAHSEAPTPVSALLSGALLNCAIYALVRVDAITLQMPGFTLTHWLFLEFGLLSVFVAALFILVQRDLKRLLAYSSVENMGIIALGLGFGGVLGVFGSLFHLLNHAVTKAALFLAGGNLALAAGTKDLEEIQGALAAIPATGLVLLLGGLALAGVPPFSVFASEFIVLSAGFASGNAWAAGLLLVALAIVFAGLVRHVVHILLGQEPRLRYSAGLQRAYGATLGIALLAALAVGLGLLLPNPLSDLIHSAARVVVG